MTSTGDFYFPAIATVESPFRTKFGVPRQPALARHARARIVFRDDPDLRTALEGLEGFTHVWILFVFHEHGAKKWKPSVRPPRLGGATKVGVLASRSMHRPNPIGLSVVRLEKIELDAPGGAILHITGHDLLDGTPVLDVKPYLPYADAVPDAGAAWAAPEIPRYAVTIGSNARAWIDQLSPAAASEFEALLREILEQDPRPAFQQRKIAVTDPANEGRSFGIEYRGQDVRYEIRDGGFFIREIRDLGDPGDLHDDGAE